MEYGSVIPEVAGAVQEAVFDAVDNTSGLHVECVNVNVAGVVFAKEPKKQGWTYIKCEGGRPFGRPPFLFLLVF